MSASVGLFIVMAAIMWTIARKEWPKAPNPRFSPFKLTAAEFPRLYPSLPHGARLLFVREPFGNWDLVFILRILYRDPDLYITMLDGPEAQRIPLGGLGHYDHIFNFEDGHYVELDNTDSARSVLLDLRKGGPPSVALGEAFTTGKPGAAQYLVKGVQVGPPEQSGYWTLDQPEFRFHLATTRHHWFMERFFRPMACVKRDGPLRVDVYVNGRLLDQPVFPNDGDTLYQHDVPEKWLKTDGFTTVRMEIHNPYIAAGDGAKLGVVLLSASFNPPPPPPPVVSEHH
jgi:hypothetical protein